MNKILILTLTLVSSCFFSYGQKVDSLKLLDNEVPEGYSISKELLCKTVHAASFYEETDLYASFLGNISKKGFQSFEKKGDKGTILYFEFEKDFQGQAFLDGLLWGDAGKPTKKKPDEYLANGNILIIWSFNHDSEIKKLSIAKVAAILK